ncbi:MAG TPA: NADH:flavin oxidoreductase/NADH oxidase family protein [Acidobacteriaceae bacterium]
MTSSLAAPLTLPCGAVLPNRICKAAMSEGLADAENHSTPRLETLYRRWAHSGAGLLLSGNVQVDRMHLERPGNIVLDDDSGMEQLKSLAKAGTEGGAHFWLQLSHTGRQVSDSINSAPLAPSCVEVDVPRALGTFAPPREMTEADIAKAIAQFTFSAQQAKEAGFTGIELHAAHGYLLSQFLSPLTNRRTDRWGGSLENRSRLLLNTIQSIRAAVGPEFPIGIKLNSSDFQKGGFTHAECIELVKLLNHSTLDLLELSGGSLEQPKPFGVTFKDQGEDAPRESTIQREAYFVEFAGAIRNIATMPVMVTGNFRTVSGMAAALEAGELDMIAIGQPMISDPLAPAKILSGEVDRIIDIEKTLNPFHRLAWLNYQIERLAGGMDPDLTLSGEEAVARFTKIEEKNMSALLQARAVPA